MRHTSGMKNNTPVWAINFSPISRRHSSAWKPTPNASHYYRDFRRVLARRFPYKIFFRISGQYLIVFRILHGAQDHPRKLRP